MPALGDEAVILFCLHKKDKSGIPDPQGNAQELSLAEAFEISVAEVLELSVAELVELSVAELVEASSTITHSPNSPILTFRLFLR